jgi:hypothetical protein
MGIVVMVGLSDWHLAIQATRLCSLPHFAKKNNKSPSLGSFTMSRLSFTPRLISTNSQH